MDGMLAGLRVLDLSLWQPGHTATQLLADLGADVLKIEPPGGDRERIMPDRVANYYGNKRSLVLDLKREEDRAKLLELAKDAEVVVEGSRPGVADRLGAGYAQLSAVNPALVYCSISGFGQTGPLAMAPGHEHNYQAYTGAFTYPEQGGEPVAAKPLVGDQGSGITAAFAILAAVLCARRTGQGEYIDVAMADVILYCVAPSGTIGEQAPAGHKNKPPAMGEFATSDGGYVVLGVFSEDHFWDKLCQALGLDTHVGVKMAERDRRSAELRADLVAAVSKRPRDELVTELARAGVPIAPVLTREEGLSHPHFWERGVVARGPDGDRRIAHPIRYKNRPALPPARPAEIGEGGDLGFSKR